MPSTMVMSARNDKKDEKTTGTRERRLFPDMSTQTTKAELKEIVFAKDSMATAILTSLRKRGIGRDARAGVIAEITADFGKGKDAAAAGTIKTQTYRGTLWLRIVEGVEVPETPKPAPKPKTKTKGKKSKKTRAPKAPSTVTASEPNQESAPAGGSPSDTPTAPVEVSQISDTSASASDSPTNPEAATS